MERTIDNNLIIYQAKGYKLCNPTGKHLKPLWGFRAQISFIIFFFSGIFLGDMVAQLTHLSPDILRFAGGVLLAIFGWQFARFPDPSRVQHRYTIRIDQEKDIVEWRRFGWRLFEPMIEFDKYTLSDIRTVDVFQRQHCYILRLHFYSRRNAEIDIPDENTGQRLVVDIKAIRGIES